MANVFVAVGTVKGKQRRVGLRAGGVSNMDLDGIKRHFSRHPLPVKFDEGSVQFVEVGNENDDPDAPQIPLHRLVRDPKALQAVIEKANAKIEEKTGEAPQAVENLNLPKEGVTELPLEEAEKIAGISLKDSGQ